MDPSNGRSGSLSVRISEDGRKVPRSKPVVFDFRGLRVRGPMQWPVRVSRWAYRRGFQKSSEEERRERKKRRLEEDCSERGEDFLWVTARS